MSHDRHRGLVLQGRAAEVARGELESLRTQYEAQQAKAEAHRAAEPEARHTALEELQAVCALTQGAHEAQLREANTWRLQARLRPTPRWTCYRCSLDTPSDR